jgi:hypothetical protein
MKTFDLTISVHQPSIEDYEALYPHFPCNSEQKKSIFSIITLPANMHAALTVTAETGNSPVTVFETKLATAIESGAIQPLSSHEKQFVGTVTAVVMSFNGFEKANKKQRFTQGLFKSAELYFRS